MDVPVKIKFETSAEHRFLVHKRAFVQFNASGEATIQVTLDEADVILFGIEGTPGTEGTITLTPPSPHTLDISSHPIKLKIAQGKIRTGSSRFFSVS